MPLLRVHNLAMSLDGYVAGPQQSLGDPLGVGGSRLHEWVFADPMDAVDNDFVARGDAGIGATVMGRNMFGPIRGPWDSEGGKDWRGWWGDNPPYHHPVFVLTHHPHEPITMNGGTTFYFVSGSIESALAQAFDAAEGADVRLGGGAATIQQYLRAGLVDEMHIAVVPIVLGRGERLFDDVGSSLDDFERVEVASSASVAHVRLARG